MISGSSVWVMGPFLKAAQYQMDDGVKQGAMEVMTNIQGTMEVMTYI